MRQVIAVAAATLVVLSGASAALAASVATTSDSTTMATDGHSEKYDAWFKPGAGGAKEEGREDNEKQQFPSITNWTLMGTHDPGASNATFRIFAQGFPENMRYHNSWVEQPDFTWNTCTSDDASAFGIDRGNDEPGTKTDKSLLQSYSRVKYTEDGILVEFYKEKTLAGNPVFLRVQDEIVSQVDECLTTPSEPGWYRMTGYINGSTQNDTTTDVAAYGATRHVYICEGCDSREEARKKLGPEPNNCPNKYGQEFVCRTWDGEYYTASDPAGDGSNQQSQSTATPTATATPTPSSDDGDSGDTSADTATPTPKSNTNDQNDGQQNNDQQSNDQQNDGQQSNQQNDGGQAQGTQQRAEVQTDSVPVTPTIAQGPGFGAALAIGALLGAALLTLRREQ